jgi:hypothetical protein
MKVFKRTGLRDRGSCSHYTATQILLFNSLPPLWMLAGFFVFFLQWDIRSYETVHFCAEGPDTFVGDMQLSRQLSFLAYQDKLWTLDCLVPWFVGVVCRPRKRWWRLGVLQYDASSNEFHFISSWESSCNVSLRYVKR